MSKLPKITPVYQNIQEVGKNIKQTKKRFTWVFQIDGKVYTFVLDASMLSGKIKLACNNKIVAMTEQQPLGTFQHNMALDDCQITILSTIDSFELRINNKAFSHMLNQEKNKIQFIKNDQSCQDFVLDQKIATSSISSNGQKRTIKLKIGSMKSSANKSTLKSVQSQDWNKMVGSEDNSFPNYFDANGNGSAQTDIDYSKVSMKKKPQMDQPQQNIDLLEAQTQVIEITPEQFCTMQQLFRSQVPVQQTSSQQKSSQSACIDLNGMNLNDFNTMQMIFQTQVDTIQNTDTKSNQPVEININLQDFSTMQMMFSTMNLGTSITSYKQETCKNAQDLLSALSSSEETTKTTQTTNVDLNKPASINLNDFSTMQMMFATNNMNPTVFRTGFETKTETSEIKQQLKSQTPKIQLNEILQPTSMDFGTMANLFKTMNYSQPQTQLFTPTFTQEQNSTVDDPLTVLGLSNSSNNANIGDFKMSDFNTMQMMFKTNAGMMPNANLFATNSQNQPIPTGDLKQNMFSF